MKRYWLFCGDDCYPGGGMRDFVGDFDAIDEVKDALRKPCEAPDWWQVVDTEDGRACIRPNPWAWRDVERYALCGAFMAPPSPPSETPPREVAES